MRNIISFFVLACAHMSMLSAATVEVTTPLQLTSVINDAAVHADEPTKIIIVGSLQGNFTVPATNYPIILVGKKGTDPTLDGNQLGTVLTVELGATVVCKYLSIVNGENENSSQGGGILNNGVLDLSHCTVSNNTSSSDEVYATLLGGGIYNRNIMTIKDCVISNNTADRGGGIYNFGNMTITKSTIENNNTSLVPQYCYGAGIYNDGYLTVTKCIVDSNTSPNGYAGGVYTEGRMTISDSTISNNGALYNTGGIENDVFLTIERCDIFGNIAESGVGGGVYNDYGDLTIKNSSVHHNIAEQGDGAGIYNAWNMVVECCQVSNNVAVDGDGGGIYNSWNLAVKCSSITQNTALNGDGGGLFNNGENSSILRLMTLNSSKVYGNQASFGGGIANEEGGLLQLFKTKVKNNTAISGIGGGGGLFNSAPSEFVLKNSKIVDNSPDNIVSPV